MNPTQVENAELATSVFQESQTGINNLCDSATQTEEIIFILRKHCHVTITSVSDFCVWRIHCRLRLLLKRQPSAHNAGAHASLSHYAMIIMPGLIVILSQGMEENEWEINLVKYFFIRLHLRCIKNVWRFSMTIITLQHQFFRHCVNSSVIVLDFGIPRPKTITSDFIQWPQQRWCAVIIV